MTADDETIARRYADAMRRRGRLVKLRRVTQVDGQPNPPVLFDPIVRGLHPAGGTTVSIDATQAVGRIIPGDTLRFGALEPIAIAVAAVARSPGMDPAVPPAVGLEIIDGLLLPGQEGHPNRPGFTDVQLAQTLPANLPDGTVVTPIWAADSDVWGSVQAFPLQLRGDQIIAGDMRIVLAALGVERPAMTDLILADDMIYSVIGIDPVYQRAARVAWSLHARTV